MLALATTNVTASSSTALAAWAASGWLLADAGTVLMHGTCFFVVIGSLLIGYGEGMLLARCFALDAKRARRWMIGANYTSAFTGLFAMYGLHQLLHKTVFAGPPLYTIKPEYWTLLAASFLFTVVIEWPFCARAFDRERRRWKRTLRASLLAQAASYLLLLPLYLWLADYNVVTVLAPDRSLQFVPHDLDVRVYYIAADDGDVYSIGLDGRGRRHEYTLDDSVPPRKLYARPNDGGEGYSLCLLLESMRDDDQVLLGPLDGTPALPSDAANAEDFDECARNPFCTWDLRPIEERHWRFELIPYSGSRLIAQRGGETIALRYETTYDTWYVQCATAARDGLVVFEAEEQILVADLDQRKIGIVARDHGPCVVLRAGPLAAATTSVGE